MKNLTIAFALMFSAITFGQMSFNVDDLDLQNPMSTDANLGWFMTDDIMISFGMDDWDNFEVGARYYTGFCDNMFIEANTNATGDEDNEYTVGVAAGWTKALGIWKLQFEPMVVVDDINDFNPRLAWGLRFNL
ncbi:MAG: hypothetical protein CMP50_01780 [Flavobacteriales bacterium]|jgi:hypothetical protein|nr:hypothetical protein [Flavobacteriales bacterium]